jgi:anti-sigma factor RsiW
MVECLRVMRVLQSYLDGMTDESTTRRVAEHLEDCRRCGLEARTYTEIKAALARRGQAPPAALARLRCFAERLLAEGESPDPDRDQASNGR